MIPLKLLNFFLLVLEMKEIPYYASYSPMRRVIHDICDSKYFDLVIAGVIGLNVVSMSLEFYMMPNVKHLFLYSNLEKKIIYLFLSLI